MGILDRLGLRTRVDGGAPVPAAAPQMIRLDSVINLLNGLGGSRDKGSTYNNRPDPLRDPLTPAELTALWQFNGLARRIVRLPAAEATRRGWHVDDTGDEERRLQLVARIREGMIWGRLYGAGPVLMVTEDDVPVGFRGANRSAWLAEPLDLKRVGKLHALHAFDIHEASPGEYDWDPASPNYRNPKYWLIHTTGGSMRVHASRVLHFRGAARPPSYRHGYRGNTIAPDDSVLQSLWDEVQRLCSTMSAGAVLAHEIRESVLKVGGLERLETSDQGEALETRMRILAKVKSVLGIVLIGPEDEYTNRSNAPTGFAELSTEAKSMLAGVLGWPMIVLFGDAPSGFSTDGASGWQTFNRDVVTYQEDNRPLIERSYEVLFAAQDGPTGGIIPDELAVEFLPLDEPTEKEKAETRFIVAQTDAIYLDRATIVPEDITRARFGPEGWQLDLDQVTPPDDDIDFAAAGESVEEVLVSAAPADDVQASALNGSQIESALSIVERVALKSLPRESGVVMLQEFFQSLGGEKAERIMGAVGKTFFIDVPAAPEPGRFDADDWTLAYATALLRLAGRADAGWAARSVAVVLRADAVSHDDSGVVVLVPVAPPVWVVARAAAADIDLEEESEPHVTVLYLGKGLDKDALAEVEDEVRAAAAQAEAFVLEGGKLTAFAAGEDGTPVVVEAGGAWMLHEIHERLFRALAHRVTAKQHPRFRPHLTLGYAADLTTEQRTALLEADVSELRIPVAELEVRSGAKVVARVALGGAA